MYRFIKPTACVLAAALLCTTAMAQTDTTTKKNREIIIRKKSDDAKKTTIVIDGDNVTIDGKPMADYKGDIDVITLAKPGRIIASRPGARAIAPRVRFDAMHGADDMLFLSDNKAVLGVATEKTDDGARVMNINPESAAAKAGLKKDDIITKVGNTKIEDPEGLADAIGKKEPNDKVEITFKRNGKTQKATATLMENKGPRSFRFDNFRVEMPPMPPMPPAVSRSFDGSMFTWQRKPKLGMQVQDVEVGEGVVVNEIDEDSPASKAGLKEGDVITGINGKNVAGVDAVREAIKDLKEGETYSINYKRGSNTQTAQLKIPKRVKTADL